MVGTAHRMSSSHSFLFGSGGAAAATVDYVERQGRYARTGIRERDTVGGGAAAATVAYQERLGTFASKNELKTDRADGHWERRGDLLAVGVTLPSGAPMAWHDRKTFWHAAESAERVAAEAFPQYKGNTARVKKFRRHNIISETGTLTIGVPPGRNGSPLTGQALKKWMAAQVAGFKLTREGKALVSGGLVIKPVLEVNRSTKIGTLSYRARSKAEWMAESTIGMKGHFSLANELTPEECLQVMEKLRERFSAMRLYSSTALHWKEGQHHFHFLVNLRPIHEDGRFARGRHEIFRDPKKLAAWEKGNREYVADVENELLFARGIDKRVEFRSDEEVGQFLADSLNADARVVVISGDRENRTNQRKREVLAEVFKDPASILKSWSVRDAVFTREQIRVSLSPTDADAEDLALVDEAVDAIVTGAVPVGTDFAGSTLFSTEDYLAAERCLLDSLSRLQARPGLESPPGLIESVLACPEFHRLSDEQRAAVRFCCANGGLGLVVGRAGTGKTTMMRAVVEILRESGYTVRGLSQYGNHAKKLGKEAGIPSQTIRSAILTWSRIAECDQMIATGRLTTTERARIESNLSHLRTLKDSRPWVRAAIRDHDYMLDTGKLSVKHIKYIRSELAKHENERVRATDVFLLDEAGKTGTRDAAAVAACLEKGGAALRMIGDPDQGRSLDAGEPFRLAVDRLGAVEVERIRRQQVDDIDCLMLRDQIDLETAAVLAAGLSCDTLGSLRAEMRAAAQAAGPGWMARASMKLAASEMAEGIKDYMRAGRFSWVPSREQALAAIADAVVSDLRDGVSAVSVLAIANTNVDVRSINRSIKAAINPARTDGGIEMAVENNAGDALGTERFDVGDRLGFLRNDNRGDLVVNVDADTEREKGVRNGERGTIVAIEEGRIVVDLDPATGEEPRRVEFDPAAYRAVTLGYALTTDKSQGETAERVYSLFDQYSNSANAYVAGTRHEKSVRFFVDRETFKTDVDLFRTISRGASKTMAADWAVAGSERPAFERVAAYVNKRSAAAGMVREMFRTSGAKEFRNHPNYGPLEQVKAEIKAIAFEIAQDWVGHERFLEMARVGRAALEIDAGLRERIVSLAEEKLRDRMKSYAAVVTATRTEWNRIKGAAGSTVRARSHGDYPTFVELRARRDALAAEIAVDPRFRLFTQAVKVATATILGHARAHREREQELTRIAGLSASGRRIHDIVCDYRDAKWEVDEIRARMKALGPSSALEPELKGAIRRQDSLAAKVAVMAGAAGDWRGTSVSDGRLQDESIIAAEMRAQRIDPDSLAVQAARHSVALAVDRYQQARRQGFEGARQRYAGEIVDALAAEKAAEVTVTLSAVMAAGLSWSNLYQDANEHCLRTAEDSRRPVLAAARAFLDARKDAIRGQRAAAAVVGVEFGEGWDHPDVRAAYDRADEAAARSLSCPGPVPEHSSPIQGILDQQERERMEQAAERQRRADQQEAEERQRAEQYRRAWRDRLPSGTFEQAKERVASLRNSRSLTAILESDDLPEILGQPLVAALSKTNLFDAAAAMKMVVALITPELEGMMAGLCSEINTDLRKLVTRAAEDIEEYASFLIIKAPKSPTSENVQASAQSECYEDDDEYTM